MPLQGRPIRVSCDNHVLFVYTEVVKMAETEENGVSDDISNYNQTNGDEDEDREIFCDGQVGFNCVSLFGRRSAFTFLK